MYTVSKLLVGSHYILDLAGYNGLSIGSRCVVLVVHILMQLVSLRNRIQFLELRCYLKNTLTTRWGQHSEC